MNFHYERRQTRLWFRTKLLQLGFQLNQFGLPDSLYIAHPVRKRWTRLGGWRWYRDKRHG